MLKHSLELFMIFQGYPQNTVLRIRNILGPWFRIRGSKGSKGSKGHQTNQNLLLKIKANIFLFV